MCVREKDLRGGSDDSGSCRDILPFMRYVLTFLFNGVCRTSYFSY